MSFSGDFEGNGDSFESFSPSDLHIIKWTFKNGHKVRIYKLNNKIIDIKEDDTMLKEFATQYLLNIDSALRG